MTAGIEPAETGGPVARTEPDDAGLEDDAEPEDAEPEDAEPVLAGAGAGTGRDGRRPGNRSSVAGWSGWKPSTEARSRPALPPGLTDRAGAGAKKVALVTAGWVRQRPLAAVAVVLLGLGGLVYPPLWLLGAVVAMASRAWDARDKWLGLMFPLVLVIIGTGADVTLGGPQSGISGYAREAWMFADHLSRVVAVLGAVYLVWRTQRPPRMQPKEPWKKNRRFN